LQTPYETVCDDGKNILSNIFPKVYRFCDKLSRNASVISDIHIDAASVATEYML